MLASTPGARRNLVFMISDGFGVASETMARAFVQQAVKVAPEWSSALDNMLVGTTRTRSSNTLVTDSAAGATAFSCAKKSFNGAIGITSDKRPCGTVLEAAKAKGYSTGLVTTARITHATPAAFAAHAVDRNMEDLIAQQEIGNNSIGHAVDLMFGGGRCFFLPKSHKDGCRSDDLNVWDMARTNGYSTLNQRKEFDSLSPSAKLPILGLFASGHMSFEIDRNPDLEPTLAEMTLRALDILHASVNRTSGSHPGFFLMVEGARIDMAGHDNDPATHLHDIVEYWKAVEAVAKFVDDHPDTTLVSTSDHETGGLTLGIDPDYAWYPDVLANVKSSAEAICSALHRMPAENQRSYITSTVLPQLLGIANYSDADVSMILGGLGGDSKSCKRAVGHTVSLRARIGWTTGGHTGTDVGLYAYGPGAAGLRGSHENTQVGAFLARYLGVDLDSVTQVLSHEQTEQQGSRRIFSDDFS
ncbi:alkaline phosphatase-like protein [Martensiomyces pterosporus]|nr:alkaline phosphatase-like protein [Martensiomyces pterosporus]